MDCPACKSNLRQIAYEGVDIHTCDSCGGEFVGPEQLALIVNVREERFGPGVIAQIGSQPPTFAVPVKELQRTLECPACHAKTTPINYAGDTGVVLDRCRACSGLWLDRSELEKIQALLEKWQDQAPANIRAIADQIKDSQRRAASLTTNAFRASRFSFVNAVINRLLDAA